MNLTTTTVQKVEPEHLADALANATPIEFKAVWLEFNRLIGDAKDRRLRLMAIAAVMAPSSGRNCQKPLRELVQYIDYQMISTDGINVDA